MAALAQLRIKKKSAGKISEGKVSSDLMEDILGPKEA